MISLLALADLFQPWALVNEKKRAGPHFSTLPSIKPWRIHSAIETQGWNDFKVVSLEGKDEFKFIVCCSRKNKQQQMWMNPVNERLEEFRLCQGWVMQMKRWRSIDCGGEARHSATATVEHKWFHLFLNFINLCLTRWEPIEIDTSFSRVTGPKWKSWKHTKLKHLHTVIKTYFVLQNGPKSPKWDQFSQLQVRSQRVPSHRSRIGKRTLSRQSSHEVLTRLYMSRERRA